MKKLLYFIAVLGAATAASAQTVSPRLQWDQPNATVAEAQAYAYTLKVDSAAAVNLTQTCALVGTVTRCTAPITPLTSGTHTLTLTVFNGFGSVSAGLTGSSPTTPVSISITITISIP